MADHQIGLDQSNPKGRDQRHDLDFKLRPQDADQAGRRFHKEPFIHKKPLAPVRKSEPAHTPLNRLPCGCHRLNPVLNPDGRREACEKQTSHLQGPPKGFNHGVEVSPVSGEMEHSVADHDVEGALGEVQILNCPAGEAFWRQPLRDVTHVPARPLDGLRALIDTPYLGTDPSQIP